MNGFLENIEELSKKNSDFRRVLYTAKNSQLVIMSLSPGEDIGEEIHDVDQFFRIETGFGEAVLAGKKQIVSDGFAVIVPAGTRHNIKNTGDQPMKLYTLYSPPNHLDGTIHMTKKEAENEPEEHFDGRTTE